jgi:NADP-dependent 3-hydroxy acid dehydrogenase YdfG
MPSDSDPLARFAGALDRCTATVTGAGSGIGRAVAVAFAAAGANVALLGRRRAALAVTASRVEAAGRRALVLPTDVTGRSALAAAVAAVERDLGPADLVVAAAGVNAWGRLEELPPGALRAALATNLEAVADLARLVIPGMRARGRGKLIVIASDNGRRPEAEGSAYVASKFGVVGFALSLSRELYGTGVGVHVIEPGCVDTEWYPPEENAPRNRMLRPEDVALVAMFLATLPARMVLEEVELLPRGLLAEPWT